jgi:hypothetical protein
LRGATDDFLQDLMAEDEEARALLSARGEQPARPVEAEWPAWSGHLRTAWDELKDDRFIGAMGGMGRIYYTAIDAYGRRNAYAGDNFQQLTRFLRVLDDEYLRFVLDRQEQQRQRRKNET